MVLLSNLFVLAPFYIYPSENAWQELFTSISNNPTLPFKVVINPNNGPGASTYPDSNYISNIAKLNSYNNTQTIAYVHTAFATRATAAVEADINTYNNWANYKASDIHVDGIFLDEAPTDTSKVAYMANLYSYVKKTLPSENTVITNPGVRVDSAFYQYADYINAFENTQYFWDVQGPNSIPAAERSKSTVVIYNYMSGSLAMVTDIENIAGAGFGGLFISTQDNYSTMSSTWPVFVTNTANAIKALVGGINKLTGTRR